MSGSEYMIVWSVGIVEVLIPAKYFSVREWVHPTNKCTVFCPGSAYFN